MKCECCKKTLKENMGGQKFCIPCSLYIRELRRQLSYWKGKTKQLRKERENERLR